MTVFRHPNGRTWRYDFWLRGKRYTGNTLQEERLDAMTAEREIKLRLRQELAGIRPSNLSAPSVFKRTRRRAAVRCNWVYFIQAGDAIKIGFARDVNERVAELQIAHPDRLVLLAKTKGGSGTELKIHRRFAHLRRLGEWFTAAPELLAFVDAVANQRKRKSTGSPFQQDQKIPTNTEKSIPAQAGDQIAV